MHAAPGPHCQSSEQDSHVAADASHSPLSGSQVWPVGHPDATHPVQLNVMFGVQTAGLPMQLQPVSQASFELQSMRQTLPLTSAMQDQPAGQFASSEHGAHTSPVAVAVSHRPVSWSQLSPAGQPISAQCCVPDETQSPSTQVAPSAQAPHTTPHTSPHSAPLSAQVSVQSPLPVEQAPQSSGQPSQVSPESQVPSPQEDEHWP